MMKLYAALAVVPALFLTSAATSQETYDACVGKFTFVESGATYEDFDFWVGEWQVVATESGDLRGYDKIEMIHSGCVLKQEWHQMDDLFSSAEAPVRIRGTSLTGIDAKGRWRQLWTDNSGSNILLTGGMDEKGVMTLKSDWIEVTTQTGEKVRVRNIWHWAPQDDGTIHNWGEQQRDSETGPTTKYYDITYHRSVKGGLAFGLRTPKPE